MESSNKEIADAVKKANAARDVWQSLGLNGRAKILLKVHDQLGKNKEQLAIIATKEMGMPITQSLQDIDSGLNYFKWYLDNASKY